MKSLCVQRPRTGGCESLRKDVNRAGVEAQVVGWVIALGAIDAQGVAVFTGSAHRDTSRANGHTGPEEVASIAIRGLEVVTLDPNSLFERKHLGGARCGDALVGLIAVHARRAAPFATGAHDQQRTR